MYSFPPLRVLGQNDGLTMGGYELGSSTVNWTTFLKTTAHQKTMEFTEDRIQEHKREI